MKKLLTSLAILATLAAPVSAIAEGFDAKTEAALEKALNGDHRSEANKARDAHRHPKDVLDFFGLKSDMTVVEISPAGGWYAEIIAPTVAEDGKYYAAHYSPNNTAAGFHRRSLGGFLTKIGSDGDNFGKVVVTEFDEHGAFELAPEPVDMIVSFRNVHNWLEAERGPEAFAAFYAALKPGGTLGLIEHRLPEDRTQDPKAGTGYVKQSFAIEMAEAAGFQLVATSEVNANPKDTADHPRGVWTLPPSFALRDQDREKYAAIGESDRFTLKFVKPAE